jgi:hypothetical protein
MINPTFRLEMDVFEERRARHQLGVDFQFTTSPGDKMTVLSRRWGMNTRYWRMVTEEMEGVRPAIRNLGSGWCRTGREFLPSRTIN